MKKENKEKELHHSTFGVHFISEFSGCPSSLLSDLDFIRQALIRASEKANLTIFTVSLHRFYPQGVSGVVVISESHLSIHTWPEVGYAAIDVYSCGEDTHPEKAIEYLIEVLKPQRVFTTCLERGIEWKENSNLSFSFFIHARKSS